MGWADRFWTASNWVVDTTIHAVADTMNTCGTLACTLGGVAFAVSNALDQQEVSAAYYGSVHALGNFDLGINVTNHDLYFNETFPLSYSDHANNGTIYGLTDYINSDIVRAASIICVTSGAALKVLGANINKWQESREEKRYYAALDGIQISSPRLQEYLYVSAQSLTSSLSNALLSQAIIEAILHFSEKVNITYPPYAEGKVSGLYYTGPVILQSFPIKIKLDDSNMTLNFPFFGELDVSLTKKIDAIANATYGGGFFFKKNELLQSRTPTGSIEAVSTAIGTSAYLASNFFAKKAKQLHDERIRQEETSSHSPEENYLLINN